MVKISIIIIKYYVKIYIYIIFIYFMYNVYTKAMLWLHAKNYIYPYYYMDNDFKYSQLIL